MPRHVEEMESSKKRNSTRHIAGQDEKPMEDAIDEVDAILHSAIDIDQSIVLEAESLQSDSSSSSSASSAATADLRVDREARRIAAKALRQGDLLHKARRRLRQEE